ncbi:MAG TPA: hypothetical protein VGI48_11940 [Caldimonas sp.]
MRLSLIGATAAAVIAMSAIAVPALPGATAAVDGPASLPAEPAQAREAPGHSTTIQHYIDLNSATRKELMTLPGVGAAEASRIITNRPYLTKTELVTKNVMPIGPFLSVRNLVVAMPKTAPKERH